jgi:hypothetical protein
MWRYDMEIEYRIDEFNDFINNIQYKYTEISYLANTFWIDFISEKNEEAYKFYVPNPWRIILNNKILSSYIDCPYSRFYEETEEKREQFINDYFKWDSKTEFIKNEKKKKMIVFDNCDLVIEWENGAIFNSFVEFQEDRSYVFFDIINSKCYDFYYGKIMQNDLK